MGWGEGDEVGVECRASWLVIRSSLPPRSLQGHHGLALMETPERWCEVEDDSVGERENGGESSKEPKCLGGGSMGTRRKGCEGRRDRRIHVSREKWDSERHTGTNAKREAHIQEEWANATIGTAEPTVWASWEQQPHQTTQLHKTPCWSMEKWVQSNQ